MAEPFQFVEGRWWKWSAYQFDGQFIRPHAEAHLTEYDPWETFRAMSGRKTPYRRAYHDLLDLDALCAPMAGDGGIEASMTPDMVSAILDWCRRYGLLGVLHQQTLSVRFHPRWRLQPDAGGCHVVQAIITRVGGTWQDVPMGYNITRSDVSCEGQPVDILSLPIADRVRLLPACSISERPVAWLLQEIPLGESWTHYFPDTAPQESAYAEYPNINTPSFWRTYAEPLGHFYVGLSMLAYGIRADANGARRPSAFLQDFVSPVGLRIGDQLSQGLTWHCPSLISSLALMAMLDFSQQRGLQVCAVCGTLFTSDVPTARYCCVTCRQTAQKRAYRSRRQQQGGSNG